MVHGAEIPETEEVTVERVRQIFDTHPAPASDAGEEAYALVRATAECVAVCTTCADACLESDPGAMAR